MFEPCRLVDHDGTVEVWWAEHRTATPRRIAVIPAGQVTSDGRRWTAPGVTVEAGCGCGHPVKRLTERRMAQLRATETPA
ncbi:MAG: hypothetical protein IPM45_04030 [Acidimicrobiales bacterium]|nr:hypothetical protein [Acidimicrobiales bacterium]